jgi:3-keto-disaccharide hydrolase
LFLGRKMTRIGTAFALCVLCGIASVLMAADKGFKPIFNGKNLDGWMYGTRGGVENKSGKGYQVENGMLFCTRDDGGNLLTVKEYSDFVFQFEFRLEPNANNGVGIRAPLEGDAAYVGMEIQILDDSGSKYTDLRPAQYHGSLYDVVAARRGALAPVGQWNSEEITAKGRRITVKVNGKVTVDANLDEIKDPEVLKKHPGLARKSGRIGFLGHGARVEFRNLRIKEL